MYSDLAMLNLMANCIPTNHQKALWYPRKLEVEEAIAIIRLPLFLPETPSTISGRLIPIMGSY